jgi:hypothetical protein
MLSLDLDLIKEDKQRRKELSEAKYRCIENNEL